MSTLLQCPEGLWSHQNSLPIGTGALPNGINRPTRSADYTPLSSKGVKIPTTIFLFQSTVPDCPGPIKTTYPLVQGLYPKG
jgi:hypothetical protein